MITTVNKHVKFITGQSQQLGNENNFFYELNLSKSKEWEYDAEWRVFIPPVDIDNPVVELDKNGVEILHSFKPLNPLELRSIYFGCKMTAENQCNIEEYLKEDLRHVRKYKCHKSDRDYKLVISEII